MVAIEKLDFEQEETSDGGCGDSPNCQSDQIVRIFAPALGEFEGARLSWSLGPGDILIAGKPIARLRRWGLSLELRTSVEGEFCAPLVADGARLTSGNELATVRAKPVVNDHEGRPAGAYAEAFMDMTSEEVFSGEAARRRRALTAVGGVWVVGVVACLISIAVYLMIGGAVAPVVGGASMTIATLSLLWGKKFVADS